MQYDKTKQLKKSLTYRCDEEDLLVEKANFSFSLPVFGVVKVFISVDSATLELKWNRNYKLLPNLQKRVYGLAERKLLRSHGFPYISEGGDSNESGKLKTFVGISIFRDTKWRHVYPTIMNRKKNTVCVLFEILSCVFRPLLFKKQVYNGWTKF